MAEKKNDGAGITYSDLLKVNSEIKTTPIKGKDYADVPNRIMAFRKLFPNGTISTEIVSLENGVVIFKATAVGEDGMILGTGHAYEKENSSFINKTSYIENAETSAVGRCLGMLGIGIDTSIASFEEVTNAMLQQETTTQKEKKNPKSNENNEPQRTGWRAKLKELCEQNPKINQNDVIKHCGLNKNSTDADYEKAYEYALSISAEGELPFEV